MNLFDFAYQHKFWQNTDSPFFTFCYFLLAMSLDKTLSMFELWLEVLLKCLISVSKQWRFTLPPTKVLRVVQTLMYCKTQKRAHKSNDILETWCYFYKNINHWYDQYNFSVYQLHFIFLSIFGSICLIFHWYWETEMLSIVVTIEQCDMNANVQIKMSFQGLVIHIFFMTLENSLML